jgi:hypothetical protein
MAKRERWLPKKLRFAKKYFALRRSAKDDAAEKPQKRCFRAFI